MPVYPHPAAAGKGGYVGVHIGLLEKPPGYKELPVEIQPSCAALRPCHKALAYAGHAVQSLAAQHLRVRRHIPPAQKVHALLGDYYLHHLLGLSPFQSVLREEEHAHAVIPGLAQGDAQLRRGLHHQPVGHLYHQPDPVAGLPGGVLAGSVLQLLNDF